MSSDLTLVQHSVEAIVILRTFPTPKVHLHQVDKLSQIAASWYQPTPLLYSKRATFFLRIH